jgi:hypothetical protein
MATRRVLPIKRKGRAAAVAALIVAAAGAVLLLTMLGGGGGGPLAQAAEVTQQSPGFAFEIAITASVGGHSVRIAGAGSMDERDVEGTMTLRIGATRLLEIIKNPYVYVKLPSSDSAAGSGGKRWVRANLDAYSQAIGTEATGTGGALGANTTAPTQMLDWLKASGQVSTLGEQSVRGVATTHYHALVDVSRYAAMSAPPNRAAMERYAQELERITGTSSLPIDVWVDAGQRLRRFSTALQLCTVQGPLTESITMTIYEYGRQPVLTAPAPSEAIDVTGQLTSQAAHVLAQMSC